MHYRRGGLIGDCEIPDPPALIFFLSRRTCHICATHAHTEKEMMVLVEHIRLRVLLKHLERLSDKNR